MHIYFLMNVHTAIVEIKACTLLGYWHCPEEQFKITYKLHKKLLGLLGHRSISAHVYLQYIHLCACFIQWNILAHLGKKAIILTLVHKTTLVNKMHKSHT